MVGQQRPLLLFQYFLFQLGLQCIANNSREALSPKKIGSSICTLVSNSGRLRLLRRNACNSCWCGEGGGGEIRVAGQRSRRCKKASNQHWPAKLIAAALAAIGQARGDAVNKTHIIARALLGR